MTMLWYCLTVSAVLFGVAAQPVNLALTKQATMSSQATPKYSAMKAVDGNPRNGNDKFSECAFTGGDRETWWQVDLGRSYLVNSIVITKRESDKYLEHLTITVHKVDPICNTNDTGKICSIWDRKVEKNATTVQCDQVVEGRYLRITKRVPKKRPLILCEVEVYGNIPILAFVEKLFHKADKTISSPTRVSVLRKLSDCAVECVQTPECDKFQMEWTEDHRNLCKLGGVSTETSHNDNDATTYFEAFTL